MSLHYISGRPRRRRNPAGVDPPKHPTPYAVERHTHYRGILQGIAQSSWEKIRAFRARRHENERAGFYRLLGALCRDFAAGRLVIMLWEHTAQDDVPAMIDVYKRHAETLAVRLGEHFEAWAKREETRTQRAERSVGDFMSGGKLWVYEPLKRLESFMEDAKQFLYDEKDREGKLAFRAAIGELVIDLKVHNERAAKAVAVVDELEGFYPPRAKWPAAKPVFPK